MHQTLCWAYHAKKARLWPLQGLQALGEFLAWAPLTSIRLVTVGLFCLCQDGLNVLSYTILTITLGDWYYLLFLLFFFCSI